MDEAEQRRWWKTGYGKITAALGVIGVLFALAQLPVQLAGFPQTVKGSINVVQDLFADKGTLVTADRIGRYDIRSFGIDEATRAFGRPDSRTREQNTCTLRWESKGVEIVFGSTTASGCDPSQNAFCAATLTKHRWRTKEGLHVGDSLQRLHSLYPNAPRAGSPGFEQQWVLDAGTLPCPLAEEAAAGLRAVTIGDYVDHFAVYYFALGE